MSKVTLYGLKDCNLCDKARRELTAAGRTVKFVDLNAQSAAEQERARIRAEDLVIRRSLQGGPAGTGSALGHPVIEAGGKTYVGWNKSVKTELGL